MKVKKTQNLLDCIPERICKWEENSTNQTTLLIPRFKNRLMIKIGKQLGKSETIKIQLDEKGSRIWKLIDGKRTVEEIGRFEKKDVNETNQQAYKRLAEFLGILVRNHFIRFK